MEDVKFQIELYAEPSGKYPFEKWFDGLKDRKGKFIIATRLNRVMLGNLGDYKSVGQGVYELRFAYGPGYRIYFGKEEERIIVLLAGGDKSTQAADVKRAHKYWMRYMENL